MSVDDSAEADSIAWEDHVQALHEKDERIAELEGVVERQRTELENLRTASHARGVRRRSHGPLVDEARELRRLEKDIRRALGLSLVEPVNLIAEIRKLKQKAAS